FSPLLPRPPRPTLFPYTTLFRSAAGSPDNTRSHFDAQDYMESGTPGLKATDDGWLNRFLQAQGADPQGSPFRAVALTQNLPRVLDRKSTRLNSSHRTISYAVFCL